MRAKRVDANQPQIVAAFRNLGFSVVHTHTLGGGIPDISIGRSGFTHWIEIKNGALPPHEKQLTPQEKKFFTQDKGSKYVVESIEDVLDLHKKLP